MVGCPKCGRARGGGESCPRCGLVFDKWTGPAASGAHLDEQGESLWSDVERAWNDPNAHEAFVQHCLRASLLGAAGRRYRERLDRQPGEPVAARMQQKILNLASQLLGMHSAPREPITRSRWFGFLILGLAILGGLAGTVFWRVAFRP